MFQTRSPTDVLTWPILCLHCTWLLAVHLYIPQTIKKNLTWFPAKNVNFGPPKTLVCVYLTYTIYAQVSILRPIESLWPRSSMVLLYLLKLCWPVFQQKMLFEHTSQLNKRHTVKKKDPFAGGDLSGKSAKKKIKYSFDLPHTKKGMALLGATWTLFSNVQSSFRTSTKEGQSFLGAIQSKKDFCSTICTWYTMLHSYMFVYRQNRRGQLKNSVALEHRVCVYLHFSRLWDAPATYRSSSHGQKMN